jgi:histidine ammonia-lyase
MVHLDGSSLTLEALEQIARGGEPMALADAARGRVRAARALVDHHAAGDVPVYGINTGSARWPRSRPHDQLAVCN